MKGLWDLSHSPRDLPHPNDAVPSYKPYLFVHLCLGIHGRSPTLVTQVQVNTAGKQPMRYLPRPHDDARINRTGTVKGRVDLDRLGPGFLMPDDVIVGPSQRTLPEKRRRRAAAKKRNCFFSIHLV